MSAGFALLLLVITIATSRCHDDTDLKRLTDMAVRFDRDTVTSESDRVRLTVELEMVTVGRQLLERMDNLTDMLTQRVNKLTDDQRKLEDDVKQCSDAKTALVKDMTDLSQKLTAAERQLSDDVRKLYDKMTNVTDLAVDMTRLSSKLEEGVYRMSGGGRCGYCPIDLPKSPSRKPKARDCSDAQQYDASSGVKTVNIDGRVVSVYCDQTTDRGGWTVIQRRLDGSVDFFRNWTEYEDGFGDKDGEYWLGLRNIYMMTSSANYSLRVDLEDFSGNTAYAQYSHFSVSGPHDNYRLSVSGYSGTAGDGGQGLSYNSNMQFSTKDRDHDASGRNCAVTDHGGWWYYKCAYVNLNSRYKSSGATGWDGIIWYAWKNINSLKRVEMKIRPA